MIRFVYRIGNVNFAIQKWHSENRFNWKSNFSSEIRKMIVKYDSIHIETDDSIYIETAEQVFVSRVGKHAENKCRHFKKNGKFCAFSWRRRRRHFIIYYWFIQLSVEFGHTFHGQSIVSRLVPINYFIIFYIYFIDKYNIYINKCEVQHLCVSKFPMSLYHFAMLY